MGKRKGLLVSFNFIVNDVTDCVFVLIGISVDFETDQISVLNTRNTPALRNYEHYVVPVSGYYVLHMHPRLSGFVPVF